MTTIATGKALKLEELVRASEGGEGTPSWLVGLRDGAKEVFGERGLPTVSEESWRFTNLSRLAAMEFVTGETGGDVRPEELADSVIRMELSARLVFVNGHLDPDLCEVGALPEGVSVLAMSEAIRTHPELVERHLGRVAPSTEDAFTALNGALMDDGLFVHVPAGVKVEHPIGVRHLGVESESGAPVIKCPRSLVIAEDGASVTIAERFSSRDDEVYLTNAVTEIVAADESVVKHYSINRESKSAYHVNSRSMEIGARAHVESHAVILGGAITRNNVTPIFEGADADAILNGVYLAGSGQHVDNSMRVFHNNEHCRSRQYYKGLLDGDGRGVFTGRIIVAREAQKTDAIQSNANLLLSPDARANSRPQLEIYADDVRCTHGATVGELDDDAIFYLRSRGMSEEMSRALLVAAFARENIERMDLGPVREWLIQRVLRRLPGTELLLPTNNI